MTDTELVAAVMKKVMGWDSVLGGDWKPLTDWNECWQIVEAMRAKGWYIDIDQRPEDEPMIFFCRNDTTFGVVEEHEFGDERRAILKAALRAVESEGEQA